MVFLTIMDMGYMDNVLVWVHGGLGAAAADQL